MKIKIIHVFRIILSFVIVLRLVKSIALSEESIVLIPIIECDYVDGEFIENERVIEATIPSDLPTSVYYTVAIFAVAESFEECEHVTARQFLETLYESETFETLRPNIKSNIYGMEIVIDEYFSILILNDNRIDSYNCYDDDEYLSTIADVEISKIYIDFHFYVSPVEPEMNKMRFGKEILVFERDE